MVTGLRLVGDRVSSSDFQGQVGLWQDLGMGSETVWLAFWVEEMD